MLASVLFFHYRIFSNYFSSFVDGLGFHVMFTACRICREIIISIMFVRNTARAGGVLVTVVIVLCIFRAVNANNRKIPYGFSLSLSESIMTTLTSGKFVVI